MFYINSAGDVRGTWKYVTEVSSPSVEGNNSRLTRPGQVAMKVYVETLHHTEGAQ